MKSPYRFIITPKGDERYNNTKDIGGVDVIVNDSIDDGHSTNREAIVVETPMGYTGNVQKGDTLIVHHNTFRLLRNQRGVLTNSKRHIKDNLYWTDEYYLHINKDQEKRSKYPYVFLKSLIKDDLEGIRQDENAGELVFSCDEMEGKLEIGQKYYFKTGVNAKYTIDGEDYYRVKINNILAEEC